MSVLYEDRFGVVWYGGVVFGDRQCDFGGAESAGEPARAVDLFELFHAERYDCCRWSRGVVLRVVGATTCCNSLVGVQPHVVACRVGKLCVLNDSHLGAVRCGKGFRVRDARVLEAVCPILFSFAFALAFATAVTFSFAFAFAFAVVHVVGVAAVGSGFGLALRRIHPRAYARFLAERYEVWLDCFLQFCVIPVVPNSAGLVGHGSAEPRPMVVDVDGCVMLTHVLYVVQGHTALSSRVVARRTSWRHCARGRRRGSTPLASYGRWKTT